MFFAVGPILKEKARQIGAHYDERHNATDCECKCLPNRILMLAGDFSRVNGALLLYYTK